MCVYVYMYTFTREYSFFTYEASLNFWTYGIGNNCTCRSIMKKTAW